MKSPLLMTKIEISDDIEWNCILSQSWSYQNQNRTVLQRNEDTDTRYEVKLVYCVLRNGGSTCWIDSARTSGLSTTTKVWDIVEPCLQCCIYAYSAWKVEYLQRELSSSLRDVKMKFIMQLFDIIWSILWI
jgi:hypothetical protein